MEWQEKQSYKRLATLTSEAKKLFFKKEEDRQSFAEFVPSKLLPLAAARENRTFGADDILRYIYYDFSAPEGKETMCFVCWANLVLEEAEKMYPHDEDICFLIAKWDELKRANRGQIPDKVFPGEILKIVRKINEFLFSKDVQQLRVIQDKFLAAKRSIEKSGIAKEARFIPRKHLRIYMRDSDEHCLGEVQEIRGKQVWIGSFVSVEIDQRTCFNKIAFVLGLESGCYVLGACGGSEDNYSHLHDLRNFRFYTKNEVHRRSNRPIKIWKRLDAQTYEQAEERKKIRESKKKEFDKIEDLWLKGKSIVFSPNQPECVWAVGEELEKKLGEPDRNYRHTVRGILFLESIIGNEFDILLVVERGDQKSGGAATRRTGKPPGWNLPGGMNEKNETIRESLVREFINESCTWEAKIVAFLGERKKKRLPGASQDNIDHYFIMSADREAGTSRTLVERSEIHSVYRVPLSKLAEFGFQNTHSPSWDIDRVVRERLMFPGQANYIIQAIKLAAGIIPGLKIPDNLSQFEKNLHRFQSEHQF